MTTFIPFILVLAIAFSLMLFTIVLISYCKKRQNKTRHGLTGMCHQSGGTMCGSCGSQLMAATGKSAENDGRKTGYYSRK